MYYGCFAVTNDPQRSVAIGNHIYAIVTGWRENVIELFTREVNCIGVDTLPYRSRLTGGVTTQATAPWIYVNAAVS